MNRALSRTNEDPDNNSEAEPGKHEEQVNAVVLNQLVQKPSHRLQIFSGVFHTLCKQSKYFAVRKHIIRSISRACYSKRTSKNASRIRGTGAHEAPAPSMTMTRNKGSLGEQYLAMEVASDADRFFCGLLLNLRAGKRPFRLAGELGNHRFALLLREVLYKRFVSLF